MAGSSRRAASDQETAVPRVIGVSVHPSQRWRSWAPRPMRDAAVRTGRRTIARVHHVILLPGGVLPAAPAYAALVAALGADVDAHPKDLEVYAGDEPPAGYSMATEVAGIARAADEA